MSLTGGAGGPDYEEELLFRSVRKLRALARNEEAQALVEYSLVLLLVALGAVSVLTTIGVNVTGPLTTVANAL